MDKSTSEHGKRGAGWCQCGARFDKFYADAGEMFQTCMNGGTWKVGDLPSRKAAQAARA